MTRINLGISQEAFAPNAIDGWRKFVTSSLLVFLSVTCVGCLSRPPLSKEQFLISVPAADVAGQPDNPKMDDILHLGAVTVAPEFEGRSLVYRISETGYEFDAYAEFLIPPDRMIGGSARTWLRGAGLFGEIAEPNSRVPATRLAELHVSEMYGDFRKADDAAAVFTMRFVLLAKATANTEPGVALSKNYSRRVRLKERTAAAVVDGLQQAFREALTELAADLNKL
ncbi:MAG TPA: hypothetical protein VJS65_07600 [Verrucomicrobiae bacterium]|nr:hypothetical protein [Verrucomicrobiae bacterium]